MNERITDTHIFFWNGPFSNWYDAEFEYKNHKFENSEQAFMWLKALHYGDDEIAEKILNTPDPRKNKALGREIKGFIEEDWTLHSLGYMIDVNIAKFSQNPDLKEHLKNSGDKIIVEASPYDKVWGIGLHQDDDRVLDESQWDGENKLGITLMTVRTKLKNK